MRPRKPKPLSPLSAALAAVIRANRETLGLAQADVAKRIGVAQPAYSRIELGFSLLYIGRLEQIAQVFNRDTSSLVREAESALRRDLS